CDNCAQDGAQSKRSDRFVVAVDDCRRFFEKDDVSWINREFSLAVDEKREVLRIGRWLDFLVCQKGRRFDPTVGFLSCQERVDVAVEQLVLDLDAVRYLAAEQLGHHASSFVATGRGRLIMRPKNMCKIGVRDVA